MSVTIQRTNCLWYWTKSSTFYIDDWWGCHVCYDRVMYDDFKILSATLKSTLLRYILLHYL